MASKTEGGQGGRHGRTGGNGGRRGRRGNGRGGGSSGGCGDPNAALDPPKRSILVLHGNRQTGDLFLSRLSSARRKLRRLGFELVAPDAPFLWRADESEGAQNEPAEGRTWWRRSGDTYRGSQESLHILHTLWLQHSPKLEGIWGFSQGARLTHWLARCHKLSGGKMFQGLQYVILASAYSTDKPNDWDPPFVFENKSSESPNSQLVTVPSLHIMGETDQLVPFQSSQALMSTYHNPQLYHHTGGHHVPMKSADVDAYIDFIQKAAQATQPCANPDENMHGGVPNVSDAETEAAATTTAAIEVSDISSPTIEASTPDEEHFQAQVDECESLSLMFPDEFELLSPLNSEEEEDNLLLKYAFPITYRIRLNPPLDEIEQEDRDKWPPRDVWLGVQYPSLYPDVPPLLRWSHDLNLLEFTNAVADACLQAARAAAETELGMPCVLACFYAARDFFVEGDAKSAAGNLPATLGKVEADDQQTNTDDEDDIDAAGQARIVQCQQQGSEIALALLRQQKRGSPSSLVADATQSSTIALGKGGSWKYTLGLIGKPSAGKSTFFNAATAFARQRGSTSTSNANKMADGIPTAGALGGAAMAPHPFTTIDPNKGYCLVPAPSGLCPEDDAPGETNWGSTHGRDGRGRRLLPVMLKDVAGLVPGAYQGRGRGNKFLHDLTDADVLIHVVDASGTADSEGNTTASATMGGDEVEGEESSSSQPLQDLAWVQQELMQWVFTNLDSRWDSISRRGRSKLTEMFSGYRQSEAFVSGILLRVEEYMVEREGRDRALEHLETWNVGDVHRLVSAFLGARFPMGLALNKSDLPSATAHVRRVQEALPVSGAHVGVPLSARQEMRFVRQYVLKSAGGTVEKETKDIDEDDCGSSKSPTGVWECLESAMALRPPVLVFPVQDMIKYEPLAGMTTVAMEDSSLPTHGMITCIEAAGGQAPSHWDGSKGVYTPSPTTPSEQAPLRDVLLMKPGSTVEDVYMSLYRLGALAGDFVRAEGAGRVGEKAKLVRKDDVLDSGVNCILRIMTNRRTKT